jgi:hypothetical protein
MEGVLVEPSEFVSLPASGLYEYLLVVYPDKPVYDKLIDEKQEF